MKSIFQSLDIHLKQRVELKDLAKNDSSPRLRRQAALTGLPSFTRNLSHYANGATLRSRPKSLNLVGMLSKKEWGKIETELREQKRAESENSLFLENLFNEPISSRKR